MNQRRSLHDQIRVPSECGEQYHRRTEIEAGEERYGEEDGSLVRERLGSRFDSSLGRHRSIIFTGGTLQGKT